MIEIFVMTSKREKWCCTLLEDLKAQASKVKCNIRVFHDAFENESYKSVQDFCNANENFYYYRTKENMGKLNFWIFNNLMYTFLDTLKFDYYIQIPDDVVLCENFINRSIDNVKGIIDICNFFTFNIHKSTYMTYQRELINGVEYWKNNWVDCCFVAKEKAIKGMKIKKPFRRIESKYKHRGSGVGHEFTEVLKEKGIMAYQRIYALMEHIGAFETAMHDAERAKTFYGVSLTLYDLKNYNKKMEFALLHNLEAKDKDYLFKKIHKLLKAGKI